MCINEMKLTFKSFFYAQECPRCKGVWLDASVLKYLKKNTYEESIVPESNIPLNSDNQDMNKDGNTDYYYYKKQFVDNGQVDDLFDFE